VRPFFFGSGKRQTKKYMGTILEKCFNWVVDHTFAALPQHLPEKEKLQSCKIVSHRGERGKGQVRENTISAFDRAGESGVWGIEFDVRWTKDLEPVVCHDPDLRRVFELDLEIRNVTLKGLKSACPLIPSLAEVIERYAKKMHLMVEIKAEPYPDPVLQNRVLAELFLQLVPQHDFHLLSLTPEMLRLIRFAPKSAFLPVAELNIARLSRLAAQESYAGILGHYAFLTRSMLTKHHSLNQKAGTGYISSRNCLFREINRGVDWIFSNEAARIQSIRDLAFQRS
jgi:glycerophosphoryl diester phosphodiesterase